MPVSLYSVNLGGTDSNPSITEPASSPSRFTLATSSFTTSGAVVDSGVGPGAGAGPGGGSVVGVGQRPLAQELLCVAADGHATFDQSVPTAALRTAGPGEQAGDGEKFTKEMQEATPTEAEQDGEETT